MRDVETTTERRRIVRRVLGLDGEAAAAREHGRTSAPHISPGPIESSQREGPGTGDSGIRAAGPAQLEHVDAGGAVDRHGRPVRARRLGESRQRGAVPEGGASGRKDDLEMPGARAFEEGVRVVEPELRGRAADRQRASLIVERCQVRQRADRVAVRRAADADHAGRQIVHGAGRDGGGSDPDRVR